MKMIRVLSVIAVLPLFIGLISCQGEPTVDDDNQRISSKPFGTTPDG
jgi:hypothetical protein